MNNKTQATRLLVLIAAAVLLSNIAIALLIRGSDSDSFNGSIDDLGISKGIARWTGNFTPPTRSHGEPYNMTIVSTDEEADSEPSKSKIVILAEDVDDSSDASDSLTENTDIKAYATLDNGSNWEDITLSDVGAYNSTVRIFEGREALTDRDDQTVRYKITTHNDKFIRIHGISHVWGENVTEFASLDVAGDFSADTDTLYVDSEDDKVGIGTTNPQAKLEIKGSTSGNIPLLYFNNTYNAISSANNDVIRIYSTYFDENLFEVTGAGNIYQFSYSDGSIVNQLVTSGSSFLSGGNFGIGTTSPDHDLEIGTGTYSEIDAGEAQFTTSSSRTFKKNIKPVDIENILEKISTIPVNTYDFRDEYCNSTDSDEKCKNKIGLIAEDFHQIFQRGSEKQLSGQEVQMALWLGVQELTEKSKEKDNEIEFLKQELCKKDSSYGFC